MPKTKSAPRIHAPTLEADDFRCWRESVNRLCLERWELDLDDLPDLRERDAFDAGITPHEFLDEEIVKLVREEFGSLAEADGD